MLASVHLIFVNRPVLASPVKVVIPASLYILYVYGPEWAQNQDGLTDEYVLFNVITVTLNWFNGSTLQFRTLSSIPTGRIFFLPINDDVSLVQTLPHADLINTNWLVLVLRHTLSHGWVGCLTPTHTHTHTHHIHIDSMFPECQHTALNIQYFRKSKKE